MGSDWTFLAVVSDFLSASRSRVHLQLGITWAILASPVQVNRSTRRTEQALQVLCTARSASAVEQLGGEEIELVFPSTGSTHGKFHGSYIKLPDAQFSSMKNMVLTRVVMIQAWGTCRTGWCLFCEAVIYMAHDHAWDLLQ